MTKDQKVYGLLQARMTSTRLPGKVLREVNSIPLIFYQINRVLKSNSLDELFVLTSNDPSDDILFDYLSKFGVNVFRGNLLDVHSRFNEFLNEHPECSHFVRLTADCPLICSDIIDACIEIMLSDKIDYISNTLKPSFPDGTDVEVVSRQSFMRLSNFNLTSYQKEHVTPGIYQNPELFELGNLFLNYNFSNYRCTVDTLDDFTFIEKLIKASIHELERSTFFELMEILKLEISASPKTKFREAISPGPWIDYSFPYVRK